MLVATLATLAALSPNHVPSEQQQIVTNSPFSDHVSAIKTIVSEYPELLWLADSNVRITQQDTASNQISWSQMLFNEKFVEFDRTIMTLKCLSLLEDGSYDAYKQFTKDQDTKVRLSFDNFSALHDWIQDVCKGHPTLSAKEISHTLRAALILGDLGKSEKAREFFKEYGPNAPDHDDFHAQLINVLKENPKLSPTFNKLPIEAQVLLLQSTNLAHYGHIVHLEGGTKMFSNFINSDVCKNKNQYAFDFDFIVYLCDVAGSMGHVNQNSSLVLNNDTYDAVMTAFDACDLLFDNPDPLIAYAHCIDQRAEWLHLNPKKPTDRVLAKIGCMLRLFTEEEGNALKKGMDNLLEKDRKLIISQLDLSTPSNIERTPTYMPAVLVNLIGQRALGETKLDRIPRAIEIGLPFIAKILQKHQEDLASEKADKNIPLNFNPIAGYVKSSPLSLKEAVFSISADGLITIK